MVLRRALSSRTELTTPSSDDYIYVVNGGTDYKAKIGNLSKGLGWIDVKSYGATGDGTTDDTTTIQSALTASANKICYFPDGTYIVNTALNYYSGTHIIGSFGAVIKIGPDLGASPIKLLQPVSTGVEDVIISNLVFDHRNDIYGSDGATPLISVDKTLGVTIQNCEFRNVQTMAVWCDSLVANPTKRLSILNNRITDGSAGGFSLFGSMNDILIQGNEIESLSDDAIAVQDHLAANYPQNIIIANNRVRDSYTGCRVYGATDVTILGNAIDNTEAEGIAVQDGTNQACSRVSITGNTIHLAGATGASPVPGTGIWSYNCDDITITGNQVYESRQHGIVMRSGKHGTISGNISVGNGESGIEVENFAEFTIGINTVMNNGTATTPTTPYGILLIDAAGACKNGIVIGNRSGDDQVTATQTHGIYISGASMGTLTTVYNDLAGNDTAMFGGIVPTDWVRMGNINDLEGSLVWDPGNLVDGAGETSGDITVTGAALGDFVSVSAPYTTGGMLVYGYIRTTNVVCIRIQNETGGTIDLASGTWQVRVSKQ